MKKQQSLFIIILISITLFSCVENNTIDSTNIVGTWKLIEQLSDPGDESAVFNPIDSNKTLTFSADGKVTTNQSLCAPNANQQIATGTYSLDENTVFTNCNNQNSVSISFELKNDFLILNFISNEGFSQKYKKIK